MKIYSSLGLNVRPRLVKNTCERCGVTERSTVRKIRQSPQSVKKNVFFVQGKETTTLGLGGYPFVGNSEMAPFFWLAPGGANFLLCLLSRRHCCSAYLLSKTQEVLFWPCLSVRSTPFTCLERAQRRENCSRGSAGRFFLQRGWLHLLNSALKLVLSWQVFEQQISAC